MDRIILNSIDETGVIDYTKWSYNTGVTAIACLRVYEETQDTFYLNAARQMCQAAVAYWFETSMGTIVDTSCFAFMLCEAFFMLYRSTQEVYWKELGDACLHYVYSTKDDNNHYPYNWNDAHQNAYTAWDILYVAPNARAFWTAAQDGASPVVKEQAIAESSITVSASSTWPSATPENLINGVGITKDMHDNASDASTMWQSTEGGGDTNPHPGNVQGAAWVMFLFDQTYSLGDLWVYNFNQLSA